MKIIYCGEPIDAAKDSIGVSIDEKSPFFKEIITLFEKSGFDGNLYVPVSKKSDTKYVDSIKWRKEAFNTCKTIIAWVDYPNGVTDLQKLLTTFPEKTLYGRADGTPSAALYDQQYKKIREKIGKSSLIQVYPSGLVAAAIRSLD